MSGLVLGTYSSVTLLPPPLRRLPAPRGSPCSCPPAPGGLLVHRAHRWPLGQSQQQLYQAATGLQAPKDTAHSSGTQGVSFPSSPHPPHPLFLQTEKFICRKEEGRQKHLPRESWEAGCLLKGEGETSQEDPLNRATGVRWGYRVRPGPGPWGHPIPGLQFSLPKGNSDK